NGAAMSVVARNASALVSAGSFQLGLTQGQLGLSITAAGRILEASGALHAQLGSDLQMSASSITLRMNDTADDAEGMTVEAAGETYAFEEDITAGVRELSIVGAELTVAGFVQASGAL